MKKNVLKKFAAAALAAATVMSSMSVMAFADDTGSTAKTGSVTITKYMGDTKLGIHCHQRIIQVWNQQERRKTYYKGLSLPM